VVFNPEPRQVMRFSLEAVSLHRSRTVCLAGIGERGRVSAPSTPGAQVGERGCVSAPSTPGADATGLATGRNLWTSGVELARWEVGAEDLHNYTSPPFSLPAGLSTLVLKSDGEDRPARLEVTYEGDTSPYSLRVAGVALLPINDSKESVSCAPRGPGTKE
jgi:hypothetical protein